jgi:hypothetical protein
MRWITHKSVFVLIALTVSSAMIGQQNSHATELRDQSQVSIKGTLRVEWRGWRRCLFLKTPAPYRLMFDPQESSPRQANEIEIALPYQNDDLVQYAGQTLVANGKLQLEAVSPYYCNGAMIIAKDVVLANGTALHAKSSSASIPASIEKYVASVILIPHSNWKFSAQDPSGISLGTENLAGCSLNGGADVLNCFCAQDFKPVSGHSISEGLRSEGEDQDGFLQFVLDEEAKHRVTINVECVRAKPRG